MPADPTLSSPLPIANLWRRAHNAKSPKERHDTAYFAWEASIRLAVAARPPDEVAPLALPSIGHWVRACQLGDTPLDAPGLLDVFALLSDIGSGKKSTPRSITPRKLIDALPAYRNQVLGHGSVRSTSFYDDAAGSLLDAVAEVWAAGVFLAGTARLVYVEAIELGADGKRRGRILSLAGLASTVEQPGSGVELPEHVLPSRLYVRAGDDWRSLHPWLLFQADDLRERVWFFNARKRSGEYLDYASGELLKGEALATQFPHIDGDLEQLFGAPRGGKPGAIETKPDDPDQFGDYRILGKLGEGGMGVVYLARQQSLERLVALKMLPPALSDDATAVARFQREIAALSRCDHPNVIKILASGEARGTHYYAMEYVEGADLSQVATALSRTGDLTRALSTAADEVRKHKAELFANVPEVRSEAAPARLETGRDRYRQLAALFRDAARGLHHLHESGILHRDIKPANLMLTAADGRVVLMDLGLAAVQDASRALTKDTTSILGTLRYMAPEQLQRGLMQVDRRADVFALGASLWELLTDNPLRDGDSEAQLVDQVLRGQPTPAHRLNSAVPSDLSVIAGEATNPDPKLRYHTAEALADDLDAWLDGRPIAARAPTVGYLLQLWMRRHKAVTTTAAAALVVIVLSTAGFIHRLDGARRVAENERQTAVAQRQIADQQRRRADHERRTAVANLRRARSTALALEADKALTDGLSMRALLLARSAIRIEPTLAAHQALRDSLSQPLEQAILRGHADTVFRAEFSPDGERIVTASFDRTARIWDLSGNTLAVLEGHADTVNGAMFSPDRRRVVTSSRDGTARIWDDLGKEVAVLRHDEGVVGEALFSPDGQLVLTASDDATARVWSTAGDPVAVLRHEAQVWTARFSPDGTQVLTGSADGTVRLWSLDGNQSRLLARHSEGVRDLSISADGKYVLSWGGTGILSDTHGLPQHKFEDGAWSLSPDGQSVLCGRPHAHVGLCDLEGRDLAVLDGYQNRFTHVYEIFAPDSRSILTWSIEGTATVWDLTGRRLASFGHESFLWSARFSPNGRQIVTASSDQTARLWRLAGADPMVYREHQRDMRSIAFAPGGETVVTASQDQTARIWQLDGRTLATLSGHTDRVELAVFSPDGDRVLTTSEDATARLWDLTGRELIRFDGHAARIYDATFSPDGRLVLTASDDGTARLWRTTGEVVAVLCGHTDAVPAVTFSPSGDLIATGSQDGSARLWDLRGNEIARLEGHSDGVRDVAFTDDGQRVWTASLDGTVRIWDLAGTNLTTIHGHTDRVHAVVLSPDGQTILTYSNDMTARTWSLDGRALAVMRGHRHVLYDAQFSPDGRLISTTSRDGTARLWSVDGTPLAVLRGHTKPVRKAPFSPDGRFVATASWDGTARIWRVDRDELLAFADDLSIRDLTDSERELYGELLATGEAIDEQ